MLIAASASFISVPSSFMYWLVVVGEWCPASCWATGMPAFVDMLVMAVWRKSWGVTFLVMGDFLTWALKRWVNACLLICLL